MLWRRFLGYFIAFTSGLLFIGINVLPIIGWAEHMISPWWLLSYLVTLPFDVALFQTWLEER